MSSSLLLAVLVIVFVFLLYKRSRPKKESVRDKLLAQKQRQEELSEVEHSPPTSAFVKKKRKPNSGEEIVTDFQLLTRPQLSDEQLQSLRKLVVQSQKPHPALLSLTQEVSEPAELFPLIKSVPEVAARVLKTVNSPMFGLSKPITNINHATIFLGVTTVRSIALFFVTQDSFSFESSQQVEVSKKLWRASQLAGSFGFMLAKELGISNAGDIFTCSLLSYLGETAILSYEPSMVDAYDKEVSLLKRTEKLQNEMGLNQAILGVEIARHWQLPKPLITALGGTLNLLPSQNRVMTEEQERIDSLICYLACRFGDSVALLEQQRFTQYGLYNPEAANREDFLLVPSQIEELGLERVDQLFKDPTFIKKVNRMINEAS